ncbi:MAG: M48 family metallopeptidase [Candidatus Rokubacteria bacterium]|nr:M48 family metallopeptidase [Candidatus Rokubacteria bacterium]
MPAFPAVRFDGRSAGAVPVVLRVDGARVVVETPEGAVLEREPLERVAVSEPLAHAPRLVALSSGATVEVPDARGDFEQELRRAGRRVPLAVRLQARWPAVVAALATVVALLGLAYFKGVPIAARWLALLLPPRLEARMGDQVMAALDTYYLGPSHLQPARRARLADRFTRAALTAAPGVTSRLEFRSAGANAVNAFALPGGTIVLLDGLVELAGEDDAILGVLGHELGHVVHKHTTRQVLQSAGLGSLASLLWGDFSGVAASASVAIGTLRYSRDFEREADEFAIAFLRAQSISARPFYGFFVAVQAREARRPRGYFPDFLSGHPPTQERLAHLRRAFE